MSDNEIDEAFEDVQTAMTAIGTTVTFQCDGAEYQGVIGTSDVATQMLTGGYQGRSQLVIRATKPQFNAMPAQRGQVIVFGADGKSTTAWDRKQVDSDEPSHYVFTLIKKAGP